MKRRAHIEFLSKEKIVVTTFSRQKTVDIKCNNAKYLDLVSLNLHEKADKLKFFAEFCCEQGDSCVFIYTNLDHQSRLGPRSSGFVEFLDKSKVFSVSIPD